MIIHVRFGLFHVNFEVARIHTLLQAGAVAMKPGIGVPIAGYMREERDGEFLIPLVSLCNGSVAPINIVIHWT